MKKLLVILCMTICTACKTLDHVPAKELSLAGSTWKYKDHDWTYEITFNSDSSFSSTHPNDMTLANDSWQQNGTKINFNFNNGFSKYYGEMKSLNLIKGKARNESNTWQWTLRRIR